MVSTFYPPHYLGGASIHVYNLSNELAKRGHEVHVIYSIDAYLLNRKQKPKGDYPNHSNVILHPIETILGRATPIISGFLGLSYPLVSKALALIREIQPDVVHHHNISGFGPAVLDTEASKVFYTAHDYWLICQRNNLLKPDRTYCENRRNCILCSLRWKRPPQLWRLTNALGKRLSNIDTIITPSEYMKTTLQQAGISRPIRTLPNYVPEPEENSENAFPLPYFLYVGQLAVHKGLLQLVEVFSQIQNHIDASLLVAGSGPLEEKLKRIITQKGCQDRIKLLGHIDSRQTLSSLYANALALIIPSIWPENAPLVALEALACGTPVITSNRGGLPEISSKLNPDLIYNDIDGLKDILIRTSRISNDLSATPRQVYKTFFTPEIYIERYLTALSK